MRSQQKICKLNLQSPVVGVHSLRPKKSVQYSSGFLPILIGSGEEGFEILPCLIGFFLFPLLEFVGGYAFSEYNMVGIRNGL